MRTFLGILALWAAALPGAAAVRPLVSVLGTCAALTPNTYPADAQAWFDASKESQIVFYAHLLFPLRPTASELDGGYPAWHPPLALSATAGTGMPETRDEFYAEALWEDPSGARVAAYGLTFAARTRGDYLRLDGRDYIPHTFAMAIGTKDLRAAAGQVRLPSALGEYTIRLKVDGRDTGLAFFRMMAPGSDAPPKAVSPGPPGQFQPLSAGAKGGLPDQK